MVYASRDMFEVDETAAPAVLGAEEEDEEIVEEVAEQEPPVAEQGVDPSE
ncbi:hypothetical protein GCM10027174_24510 [Salinifilum aidingensis]